MVGADRGRVGEVSLRPTSRHGRSLTPVRSTTGCIKKREGNKPNQKMMKYPKNLGNRSRIIITHTLPLTPPFADTVLMPMMDYAASHDSLLCIIYSSNAGVFHDVNKEVCARRSLENPRDTLPPVSMLCVALQSSILHCRGRSSHLFMNFQIVY